MQRRSVIFVVISVLVVALIYSLFTPFIVFAEAPASGYHQSHDCGAYVPTTGQKCCWRERVPGQILGKEYCQTCKLTLKGVYECTKKEPKSLEQPPTPPPSGPAAPLQDGVFEQPPTPPPTGPVAPLQEGVLDQLKQDPEIGFSERQPPPPTDQGAAEPPTEPATVEEGPVPPCLEGQVLEEETGLCVLEEPEAVEEPEEPPAEEEQQPTDEQQPSEESNSGDSSNN